MRARQKRAEQCYRRKRSIWTKLHMHWAYGEDHPRYFTEAEYTRASCIRRHVGDPAFSFLPRLPASCDGITSVQIGDYHHAVPATDQVEVSVVPCGGGWLHVQQRPVLAGVVQ